MLKEAYKHFDVERKKSKEEEEDEEEELDERAKEQIESFIARIKSRCKMELETELIEIVKQYQLREKEKQEKHRKGKPYLTKCMSIGHCAHQSPVTFLRPSAMAAARNT